MKLKFAHIISTTVTFLFWALLSNVIQAKPNLAAVSLQIDGEAIIGSTNKLEELLGAVGVGYSPPTELAGRLQRIGIKRLRLINVDYGNSRIVNGHLQGVRLDQELDWCKTIGAQPHIIIGQGIPPWLSTHGNDPKFGPKDWNAYQDYIRLFFQHVILARGFREATWEVGNEPDCGGGPVPRYPRCSKVASEEDYQAYLQLYHHIALAAAQFEKDYPELKVTLGGPASSGPMTYNYGAFNWHERFLLDIAREGLKLDFFSFHYYGNQSTIGKRPNPTKYPPFEKVMESLRRWIAQYKPGLPIWITEWGPSCFIHLNPIINGNHAGAAWSAAFVDTMLRTGVERAIFLATADHPTSWAWPALFHGITPKPIYYLFAMFQKLRGQLVQVQGGSTAVGALAAREDAKLAVVLWNYNWQRRGVNDLGQEGAQETQVSINFTGLPIKMDKKWYQVTCNLISEKYGNPFYLTLPGKKASPEPLGQDLGRRALQNGVMEIEISLSPSSVALLEVSPAKSE